MSVTPEEIARLAALARLPLSPAEAERLRADLDAILAHVRTLGALAHRSAQPFAGTGPGYARLRDDGGLSDGMLLPPDALAPEWEDGFFIVPRLSSHADTPIPMPAPSMVGAAVQWEPYVDDGMRAVPADIERKPGAEAASPPVASDLGRTAVVADDPRRAPTDVGETDIDDTLRRVPAEVERTPGAEDRLRPVPADVVRKPGAVSVDASADGSADVRIVGGPGSASTDSPSRPVDAAATDASNRPNPPTDAGEGRG